MGSCAVIQNPIFPVIVPLNGLCLPREAPDTLCTSDIECAEGKTCQLASLDLEIGPEDPATGVRQIRIPRESLILAPAEVSGLGTACILADADGTGLIDCDGGTSDLSATISVDHNTTPNGCFGGTNDGGACATSAECPPDGSVTHPCEGGLCRGGQRFFQGCNTDADCPDFDKPCLTANGGSENGLPDDPECDDTFVLPDGSTDEACREAEGECAAGSNEGGLCFNSLDCPPIVDGACATVDGVCTTVDGACTDDVCVGGANDGEACSGDGDCDSEDLCVDGANDGDACNSDNDCAPHDVCISGSQVGKVCTDDDDCPPVGETCVLCNTESPHAGVCNSPNQFVASGDFSAGDARVTLPLAIAVLASTSENGPDTLPCTSDDTGDPPAPVNVILSTGTNVVRVFDARNDGSGAVIEPGATCGALPCLAETVGQGLNCEDIAGGNVSGMTFGGGFPALDTLAGDIATTFKFVVE